MGAEYIAGIIGGLVGAGFGVFGAFVSAYWAPGKLQAKRDAEDEKRIWGPRKALIKEMLDNAVKENGRSLKTLRKVTGTPHNDLRRLLVEIGARGFTRPDGEEAWVYKIHRPLKTQEQLVKEYRTK